jgi:hypothetical protein
MTERAMNRIAITLCFALWFGLVDLAIAAESEVGIITKVVPLVDRKPADKDWSTASKGEAVFSGDRVRTGAGKSLAIIKFKDRSFLRLHENSELSVTAESKGPALLKDASLLKGVMGFNVETQKNGDQFRFTSPTSVASIRGTRGLFLTKQADTLIITEGLVRFRNLVSGQEVDVPAGFAGFSFPDGTIQVRAASPAELGRAEDASRGVGEGKVLEFDLRDGQGNRKKLKIEFDE